MIRVSVLYPNSDDIKFDMEYYLNIHAKLVGEVLGDALKAVTIDYGLCGSTPEEKPSYIVMTNLTFESLETFQNSFGPNAEKLMGDIPNFTNITPQVQISEVKI